MSDDITTKIAELEASLRIPGLPAAAREAVEQQLAILRAQVMQQQSGGANLGVGNTIGQTGDVVAGDQARGTVDNQGRIDGAAVGINYGTIQAFFGARPPADAQELAANYFDMLVRRYDPLRLSKLLSEEQTGHQQVSAPSLSLVEVFVSLVTNYRIPDQPFQSIPKTILSTMDEANPQYLTPEQVRLGAVIPYSTFQAQFSSAPFQSLAALAKEWSKCRLQIEQAVASNQSLFGYWYHPELVVEAIAQQPRLVLLGDPGCGKSTVLRYITILLAKALRSNKAQIDLHGWENVTPLPIPFFCSLSVVSQRLDDTPAHDKELLLTEILAPVEATIRLGLRESVLSACRRGQGLLFFDGLDEVPNILETVREGLREVLRSRRERVIDAIQQIATDVGNSRIVVTSRIKPYEQQTVGRFPDDWAVRKVEPLTFGQVRNFVPKWYLQAIRNQHVSKYEIPDVKKLSENLINDLERLPKLREITASPLLLTMLSLLHYNQARMPDVPADVCEELVKLLLERWEVVRSAYEGQRQQWKTLNDYLDIPSFTTNDLEKIRSIIHRLALEAHAQSVEDRGQIPRKTLKESLEEFFSSKIDSRYTGRVDRTTYIKNSDRFLRFISEESGLLLLDDEENREENYVLPHLMLQEYLAACFLSEQQNVVVYALSLWRNNSERWREPLLFLMVRLTRLTKLAEIQVWLNELIDLAENATEEPSLVKREQHVVFAEECYKALGNREGLIEALQRTNALTSVPSLLRSVEEQLSKGSLEQQVNRLEKRLGDIKAKLAEETEEPLELHDVRITQELVSNLDRVLSDLHQGQIQIDDDGRIHGVAVGVNLGRIIYGRDPMEDERRRLIWYLVSLANKLYQLPLRGLDNHLDQGEGLALPKVYVTLATMSQVEIARGQIEELSHYIQDAELHHLAPHFDPDYVLPDQAIVRVEQAGDTERYQSRAMNQSYVLWRSLLATEAILQHRRLVLLGDPGAGKSTFIRFLAWVLAQRAVDQGSADIALLGWDESHPLLPIILPLRTLVGRLERDGMHDSTVYAALHDEMQSYGATQVDDILSEALHRGMILLLLDGLDEVPLAPVSGTLIGRKAALHAVGSFARLYPQANVVITCRTRTFDEALRAELNWPIETIAPFTLGQMRHFITAWYSELAAVGQITAAQASRLQQDLINAIIDRSQLRAMAGTPLLLTMMALVIYNKGEFPRDRPLLYEHILDLLLGRWDKVRDGQSLAEAIGVPNWGSERFRPLLDWLSFQVHADATSVDGRGRIKRADLYERMFDFFTTAGLRDAYGAAQRYLDYIEQRSGLLIPDSSDSYAFPHLTLQEYLAGRALVLDPDAAGLVLRHRADDRWREPILLGLGVAQQINPALLDRVLTDLIDMEEDGRPKPVERWQRDLILAAEIGKDRDWGYLRTQRVNVARLQRDLKRGLVALLQDAAQPLPIAERVRAGFLLGDLGDPRFPVTLDEWRREVARAQQGDAGGYFCRVEAGTYTIGSREDDPDAQDNEKPQHMVTFDAPFLIGRYPITNAQWQLWVEQASGKPSYSADDSDLNGLNQPVVSMTWRMCNEFCGWLSAQLGVTVRLPTEQEWEATARGGDARCYPWGDEWQGDHAATAEDWQARGVPYTAPVGCYPTGVAPCGALDMAGNVWEWTASVWQSYPGAKKAFTEDVLRVLRGGGWNDTRNRVRCGARYGDPAGNYSYYDSFRVVLSPPLAQPIADNR